MRKKIQNIKNDTDGVIMLEAIIVYMITIFLLFFILALFCIFYHIWNIQTIANEAAMRIAQTYKFSDADVDMGYVTLDQLIGLERYRYMSGASDRMTQTAQEKITGYVNRRLNRVSFVDMLAEPEISLCVEKDGLASRHVELSISEKFSVPFGTALDYFGYEDEITYECTAYADCLDLIDYVNTIDYTSQQISLKSLDSSTIDLINSILNLFHTILDKS